MFKRNTVDVRRSRSVKMRAIADKHQAIMRVPLDWIPFCASFYGGPNDARRHRGGSAVGRRQVSREGPRGRLADRHV